MCVCTLALHLAGKIRLCKAVLAHESSDVTHEWQLNPGRKEAPPTDWLCEQAGRIWGWWGISVVVMGTNWRLLTLEIKLMAVKTAMHCWKWRMLHFRSDVRLIEGSYEDNPVPCGRHGAQKLRALYYTINPPLPNPNNEFVIDYFNTPHAAFCSVLLFFFGRYETIFFPREKYFQKKNNCGILIGMCFLLSRI